MTLKVHHGGSARSRQRAAAACLFEPNQPLRYSASRPDQAQFNRVAARLAGSLVVLAAALVSAAASRDAAAQSASKAIPFVSCGDETTIGRNAPSKNGRQAVAVDNPQAEQLVYY